MYLTHGELTYAVSKPYEVKGFRVSVMLLLVLQSEENRAVFLTAKADLVALS